MSAGGGSVRVLFVTSPAEGHFYPMVPLAWALRAAGHEVLVAAPDNFQPHVAGAGLLMAASCEPLDMIETMRPEPGTQAPQQSADPEVARANTAVGFAKLAALALPGTDEIVARWKPDVIVAEPAALAAPVAAARHQVPWVRHSWGLALPEALLAIGRAALAERCGGAEPTEPDAVVDVCPPSFQFPDAPPALHMRYVPYNGHSVLPQWAWHPTGRRRVCVTLGTVLPRYGKVESLLETALTALGELDVEVLVAMHHDDGARLTGRAALRSGTWLPLGAILPSCSVVVHHGGSGTTMTALAAGLPQVAMPHFADQFANAERLAESGAGVAIMPGQLSVPRLLEVLREVMDRPAYRLRARGLAEENARQLPPAQMASLVLEIADGSYARTASAGHAVRGGM